MCEIEKSLRRAFRDQDPPRICNKITENLSKDELEVSGSTKSPFGTPKRAGSFEKRFNEPNSSRNQNSPKKEPTDALDTTASAGSSRDDEPLGEVDDTGSTNSTSDENFLKELNAKVPIFTSPKEVIFSGITNESDGCVGLTNGKEMAPVLGVPTPPPAPHMGPDGLILPRKLTNPCLSSINHKDLHRELLFNQRVGKNVLNQKSELQRAMERQREAASRREAERLREESFKDDPRTALQRAIEQRAKALQLAEQPRTIEPPNPLVTARAKLRTRTDSQ